ncbi:MAG: YkgJ family cysteine cluster protein [Polyangiaceae bacterium]|nr:YkgJ family cysteine cluster protein [Polyangiaceae bacterium]
MVPEEFDCEHCGACCHQRSGTILVEASDLVRWKRAGRTDLLDAVEPGHFGLDAFKMKDGACTHLGTTENPAACRIYPDRGTVCRAFEAGSQQCREFRRDRGIEPPLERQPRA